MMIRRAFAAPLRVLSALVQPFQRCVAPAPPPPAAPRPAPAAPQPELAPPLQSPPGWPHRVREAQALTYLTALAVRDRARALAKLGEWRPLHPPGHGLSALVRDLVPEAVQGSPRVAAWLLYLLNNQRTADWIVGLLPSAIASAVGLVQDAAGTDQVEPRCGNPLHLRKSMVVALLRTPVSEGIARAWARVVCSSGDAGMVAYFIKHVPDGPWSAHRDAMARGLPDYTRRLMGRDFAALLQRWHLPASVPALVAPLDMLIFLSSHSVLSRRQEAKDLLFLCPPAEGAPQAFEAWAQRMGGRTYDASLGAIAHFLRVAIERGKPRNIRDAATLHALLRVLPGEHIAALKLEHLHWHGLPELDAATVLEMADRLRAHHPAAFAQLLHHLHRHGCEAKAKGSAQQAALDTLLRVDLAQHATPDLAAWAKRIERASPSLARDLTLLGKELRDDAPGWENPLQHLQRVARNLGTPPAGLEALAPLLRAITQHASPAEGAQRAKITLRTLAGPLATSLDLNQLQSLPPGFTRFLTGGPLTPACSPEVVEGLSPLLRAWVLMALHARLQHAPSSPEHGALVAGCAELWDEDAPDAVLDWLELAQRMGMPLTPWLQHLAGADISDREPALLRRLQRWVAVIVRGGEAEAAYLRSRESWPREVYARADLPTVLQLEAWRAEHLPDYISHGRLMLFYRTDLHPTPDQQQALGTMLERLDPQRVFESLESMQHVWSLAPLTARRYAALEWCGRGESPRCHAVPDDVAVLRQCINREPAHGSASELRLLADVAPQVAAAEWQALLADHGDPAWLRELLQHETPCSGRAAEGQANRLAALGRFLHICRVLQVPRADRDAVGGIVKQLLALPDVKARHRLLCRLAAALIPYLDRPDARAAIVALQQPPTPPKAIPLHLAMRLYLPAEVAALPQVQALLGTRAAYGDGSVLRQLLQAIMDEEHPDYAVEVLGWASRERLQAMMEALKAHVTPEQQRLFESVHGTLQKATTLDAAFYKKTCVRTFLNAYVLPLQRDLIACADLVRREHIAVDSLTAPQDIHARCAKKLGLEVETFQRLQRQESTLRYALGFQSSQVHWGARVDKEKASKVLSELLTACDQGTLDAYRRTSPQAKKLLAQPGGEALIKGWEQAPPPHAVPWPDSKGKSTWTVEDTGHPTQQLASVTEIHSCQSVTSTSGYNYGMLGRMACGSKRMLLLRDERGTLRARAAVRLVFDGRDRPALLMSYVYPGAGCSRDDATKAFEAYGILRARALGVPAWRSDAASKSTLHVVSMSELRDYWDECGGNQSVVDRDIEARQLSS